MLGLKVQNETLRIEPCIDANWKEYGIRYRFKTSVYNIKVKNPDGKQTGVSRFRLNGQEIPEKQIKLLDNGAINEIEIIM